jgi:hypothetical protein
MLITRQPETTISVNDPVALARPGSVAVMVTVYDLARAVGFPEIVPVEGVMASPAVHSGSAWIG